VFPHLVQSSFLSGRSMCTRGAASAGGISPNDDNDRHGSHRPHLGRFITSSNQSNAPCELRQVVPLETGHSSPKIRTSVRNRSYVRTGVSSWSQSSMRRYLFIDFLDVLTVLILSLPKASWALVEGVIMRPKRVVVVVADSSTIASTIPSWSSKRLSK
jgi:hypothetical protein